MSAELQVTFAGLCLHVIDDKEGMVAVFMPDGRAAEDGADIHEDGTVGKPHVGYIRLDLTNLAVDGAALSPGNDDGPAFEIVHRLGGNQVTFETDAPESARVDATNVPLPDFHEFTTNLAPRADLFGREPAGLLFRTLLRGGTLKPGPGSVGKRWVIPPALRDHASHGNGERKKYSGSFAGSVTWTRQVGDRVALRIADFDGGNAKRIPLAAATVGGKQVISVKIANLCADNPLEWSEFPIAPVLADVDFKWLYRLLTPAGGATFAAALAGAELPYPRVELDATQPAGNQGCIGAKITSSVADLLWTGA